MQSQANDTSLAAIYNDGYLAAINDVSCLIHEETDAHHSNDNREEVTLLLGLWRKVNALTSATATPTEDAS